MDHQPNRPTWICDTCVWPWPCPPARDRLLYLYRGLRSELGRHLGARYMAMLDDLDVPPEALFKRVFGWLPKKTADATSTRSR